MLKLLTEFRKSSTLSCLINYPLKKSTKSSIWGRNINARSSHFLSKKENLQKSNENLRHPRKLYLYITTTESVIRFPINWIIGVNTFHSIINFVRATLPVIWAEKLKPGNSSNLSHLQNRSTYFACLRTWSGICGYEPETSKGRNPIEIISLLERVRNVRVKQKILVLRTSFESDPYEHGFEISQGFYTKKML